MRLCNFFADYVIGCSKRSIVWNRTSTQYQKPCLMSNVVKYNTVACSKQYQLEIHKWKLFCVRRKVKGERRTVSGYMCHMKVGRRKRWYVSDDNSNNNNNNNNNKQLYYCVKSSSKTTQSSCPIQIWSTKVDMVCFSPVDMLCFCLLWWRANT